MKTRDLFLLGALAAAGSGCIGGGDDTKPLTHKVKIDVGGSVSYAGDPGERLSGVTVTLTDLDGDTKTAVTGSGGLWTIENVRPGVYTETYAAAGYEMREDSFGIDAYGPDDVRNNFVARPDVGLDETRLVATVAGAFAATLKSGEAPIDGYQGSSFSYSVSSGTPITVTFSRRLLDGGEVRIDDGADQFDANRSNTATSTTFSFQLGDLAQIDSDSDPQTFVQLRMVGLDALTPIHADFEAFSAVLRFNATP